LILQESTKFGESNTFIVFNNSFVMDIGIWLKSEKWIMTQKPCLSYQVRVINTILNQDTSLLSSYPYCSLQKYQMCLQAKQVANVILSLSTPFLALNFYYQSIVEFSETNSLIISIEAYPFNLSYFISIYFTVIYLTLNLITLIYLVLGLLLTNLASIDLFKFWLPFNY